MILILLILLLLIYPYQIYNKYTKSTLKIVKGQSQKQHKITKHFLLKNLIKVINVIKQVSFLNHTVQIKVVLVY